MKKFLLGFAMLLAAGTTFAQEEYISVSPSTISLKPGETQDVTVTYNGPLDKEYFYSGLQLYIDMPAGVEPVTIKTERVGRITNYYNVDLLNSLGDFGFQYGENLFHPGEGGNNTDHNRYQLLVFIMGVYTFPYGPLPEETWDSIVEDLFKIRLKASDMVETGEFKLSVNEIKFSYPVEEGGQTTTLSKMFENVPVDYQIGIDYEIGESGYGTLCWPKALDFSSITGDDFQANIGVGLNGTTVMALTEVEKVPAATPLVIKGTPGVYSLTTTKGGTEDVSESILSGTAFGSLTVGEAENIFALASKAEGVGFYRCQPGVVIPQYKAYFAPEAAAAEAYLFEETTGINKATVETSDADIYTVSGVKVAKATQKGVYIVNGKKVVVK